MEMVLLSTALVNGSAYIFHLAMVCKKLSKQNNWYQIYKGTHKFLPAGDTEKKSQKIYFDQKKSRQILFLRNFILYKNIN